ncbi:MAG: VacJ family lipoprotein [Caulobacteraceae bacterium]|nr:VacJ family lipoprotein [Caulobacteraceae bacterium]
MRRSRASLMLIASLGLTCVAQAARADQGAAPSGAPVSAKVNDPFEGLNRGLFKVNNGLDRAIVRPLALAYKHGLPRTVRTGVRNGLNNLGEPVTFVNDILQGEPKQGGKTALRFAVNSTIGIGGLFDVAGKGLDTPIHYSDFGQTLGRYGVGAGPYVFVPLLGPSNVRDGFGRIVDSFTGILNIHDLGATTTDRLAVAVLDGVDTRAEYDDQLKLLFKTATDPYATERAFYTQYRAANVSKHGASVQDLPDFDSPSEDQAPEPTQKTPQPHRNRPGE